MQLSKAIEMTHVITIPEFVHDMPTELLPVSAIRTRRPAVRQEASLEPGTPRHPNAFSDRRGSVSVSQCHERAMRDLYTSFTKPTPAA